MKLPRLLFVLGYAGLLPFFLGPAWLTFAPASAPLGLDQAWLLWGAMIAAFMAGSFWGLALIVAENPAGLFGMVLSAVLLLAAWASMLLPFPLALWGLAAVFLLLALAEIWRERTLDPMSSYLSLRIQLTVGVFIAIVWRIALHA